MVNITAKQNSYRIAVAGAIVHVSAEATIEAIRNKTVPKGDVLESSRIAALFAVKQTAAVIPDCHPLPVEYTTVRFLVEALAIHIEVEVHTIYKTGVEVEAMHGAAIAALTMYDMLKPIDKGISINDIRLIRKSGGKSDRKQDFTSLKTAVIVCSDTVSAGEAEDLSGKAAMAHLETFGITVANYEVIPDNADDIAATARRLKEEEFRLVIFSGGTGVGPRDITPDVIGGLIDTPLPGVMEAARTYGAAYTPMAMLSRGVAGFSGESLFLTLPGSPKGVSESMNALFPQLLHVFSVREGKRH
ncbi:molybdenum cofactor biosynthesis protein MoaCB [Flavihumibacter petaseus NBRC 106054]|uniref:Molybdenum cofactor biosynthesis protein MoaCB n=2 Tax=Flavihumibacter TaxID=1004301 RepID=A0A0E9N508_9BACT|nr:molybdenum cofactor biosynthesis protein MoaCB [Flavihumibacter petaseus NBRC 106054]